MQENLTSHGETVEVRRLTNGMTVLLDRLPYVRSVSAGVWIQTGSANESDDQAGISHFLEHLFFKGTATRSARELMEAVERRGGHLNAFTSRDYTCLYVKMLDTHGAVGLEILADILKHSLFADFEKERNVVLEEIASIVDVPEDYIHDVFAQRLWPDHPLGRSVAGSLDTVGGLNADKVRQYYERWYCPENMIVSVVGNFDVEAVFEQLRTEFEALPRGPEARQYGPAGFGASVEVMERDIGQNHICFGFPGPSMTDPGRYAHDVLSSAIGGGSTSRLFDRIRETEGLAYSIYSFHSCYLRSGMLGVYAAVAPENLSRVLDIAFEEMRKLRETALDEDELELNREQLKGNLLMGLEHTFNRMARLAKSIMYYDRILPVDEIVAEVDAVTADEVHEVAARLFSQEQCTMVVMGPANGSTTVEVAL